jgi:hypothetical protein
MVSELWVRATSYRLSFSGAWQLSNVRGSMVVVRLVSGLGSKAFQVEQANDHPSRDLDSVGGDL